MSGHTSAGKLPSKSGCRYSLLAKNSSISLAGSEEQINFSKQSPKMLKMAKESFVTILMLYCCFSVFFSKFSKTVAEIIKKCKLKTNSGNDEY